MLNVFEDIDIWKEKVTFDKCDVNCSVHKGFYDTYQSVANLSLLAVEILMVQYPNASITVLGFNINNFLFL